MPNSRNLAYRAAYLYYVEGLPQKEVAARLALSTPTVSRLLRRAREEGLVQIFLRDPYADYYSLEERLRVKYGLQDVIIAHIPKETPVHLAKTAIAKEGAEYLQRVLRDGDLVGIAWGSTVYELVESLDLSGVARANWVALHGSLSRMVLRFFDREGKECSTSLAARTLSVELGDYRRIPKKIAVAGGLHKAVAVQAALHGGLVDVLVTDPVLAEQITQHPV